MKEEIQKKKILVTGGTGFIGSHTVVELQNKGYAVIIADNLSNSTADVVDYIGKISNIRPDFEIIDLADQAKTTSFFEKHTDIDGIIHFAAFKAVGESNEKPVEYYRNNVGSLLNVIDGMKRNGIRDIVFSSSCTVYGQPDELPVTENAPIMAAWSPYGNTKQICEDILRFTTRSLPVRAIALRYFNPAGAHESALIGELPIGTPNNLVPFIIQTAMGQRPFLSVFGNDYNTPDGTAIRDYLHVVDLARAHVVSIDRMLKNKCRTDLEIFNLGTGRGTSVMEVIRSFEKVSGTKLNYRIVDRRPGDVERVWADTTLANTELGWKSYKGLDEIMESAWKWGKALKARKPVEN